MNKKKVYKGWDAQKYYENVTKERGKASDCVKCGQCEEICPQKLPIRELLETVVREME